VAALSASGQKRAAQADAGLASAAKELSRKGVPLLLLWQEYKRIDEGVEYLGVQKIEVRCIAQPSPSGASDDIARYRVVLLASRSAWC